MDDDDLDEDNEPTVFKKQNETEIKWENITGDEGELEKHFEEKK